MVTRAFMVQLSLETKRPEELDAWGKVKNEGWNLETHASEIPISFNCWMNFFQIWQDGGDVWIFG